MALNIKKMGKSFAYAFRGIILAAKSEQNFMFHLIVIIPVLAACFYLSLDPAAWGLVSVSIFFVLASELLNTSIEKLCDIFTGGKPDSSIAFIKDVSAGAVMLSAVNALIIGILIIILPLIKKIISLLLQY